MRIDDGRTYTIKISYDPNIIMPKATDIYLDTTFLDAEIIYIKINGRTLTFPIWEFWNILEKYNDCQRCEFY